MKNIIFIAPPAAGKGTQAEIISSKYNIAHISTGDLLRCESTKDTELGNHIKNQMKNGDLISDDIVTNLLEKRLREKDCDNGFVLDGYPRNLNQANVLESLLSKIDKPINYVFYLTVDKDIAIKRACGRRGCLKCGRIYNEYFKEAKPIVNNMCDKCNVELYKRDDDNEESFIKRFDTYIKSTMPLIKYYDNKSLLYTIDSSDGKESTSSKIFDILNK